MLHRRAAARFCCFISSALGATPKFCYSVMIASSVILVNPVGYPATYGRAGYALRAPEHHRVGSKLVNYIEGRLRE
jgi:hypothetical protein